MKAKSPYNGGLTREQFLFHEMRETARLLAEGISDEDAINKIVEENLFQYPTEKMIKNLAKVCVTRLRLLDDDNLISAVAYQSSDVAKQICLYAMMKHNRLVWDFMVSVVGDKYRTMDMSFSKMDVNAFFMRLQEQDDAVAGWSESTINKIKQVLVKVLVETEYLDSIKSDHLNPVLLSSALENTIKCNNDDSALVAFNCL